MTSSARVCLPLLVASISLCGLIPGAIAGTPRSLAPAPSAALAITKTGPLTAAAGSIVTYTVVVTNNGPSDAPSTSVVDLAPAGTTFVNAVQTSGPAFTCTPVPVPGGGVSCSIATLTALASATFSFSFQVSGAATNGTTITNQATASTAVIDPNPANNTATATTTVDPAAIPSLSDSVLLALAVLLALVAMSRLT